MKNPIGHLSVGNFIRPCFGNSRRFYLWWRPWRRLLSKVAMFKDLADDFVFLYERDDLHRAAAWFAKLLTTGVIRNFRRYGVSGSGEPGTTSSFFSFPRNPRFLFE
jgi:hypothetical protein